MKNNNYYTLTGSFDLATYDVRKKFKSATAAINYALKLLPYSEIKEEIVKSSNSVEYVISQTRRFTVTHLAF